MLTTDYSSSALPIAAPIVINPRTLPTTPLARPTSLIPLPVTRVWGLDFSVVDMEQTLGYIDQLIKRGKPASVITANLNYAMLCDKNPRLAEFTRKCPIVLCDGMPIFWRSLLNEKKLPERVAGSDLIFALAAHSAQVGNRIFLMGGAEGIAAKTADRLRELYPGVNIVGVECPPFRDLTETEHNQLLSRIRNAKPDVLLVAFGQPKGEYWIEDNAEKIGVPVSIQLGASFDFVVGNSKRAPIWMQKLGLEWLYRTYSDPKRLLPRYAKNAWFLMKAIRQELLDITA